MSGSIDVNVSVLNTISNAVPAEWLRVCRGRHNILLEGAPAATEAALETLKPYLGQTVAWETPGSRFQLHSRRADTLVVRNAAALSVEEQGRLLGWLNHEKRPQQVVCATHRSLFPLVCSGVFDETLYYRLNVILLRVGSPVIPSL